MESSGRMVLVRARDFKDLVARRLVELGESKHKAAVRAGLPPDAIRSVLDGRKPSLDRAEAICDALGLDFYLGPPGKIVPSEIARALKLEDDCSIADALDAITSLFDTMSAVQAQAEVVLEAFMERGGRDLGIEIDRINREWKRVAARQGDFFPVDFATDVRIDMDSARAYTQRAGMSVAIPWRRIPSWANPARLIFIRATGGSLAPGLGDGEMILLDRSKTEPVEGVSFLIRSAEGFTVGRLLPAATRWLAWGTDESGPVGVIDHYNRLIGRVAWRGSENPLLLDSGVETRIIESSD